MVQGVQRDDGTFVKKTFDEIETGREDRAREELGQDVDLSQGSPVKQLLDVGTLEHERIWQVLEAVYYSGFYEDAFGVQLDKILSLANISRRPRQGATGEVIFEVYQPNDDAITIPRGTRVTTDARAGRPYIPFKTTAVATLHTGDLKTETVPVRALEPWETELAAEWLGVQTNVAANTISRIGSPVAGVNNVYNPYPTGDTNPSVGYDFVPGKDAETDHELRRRWENSLGAAGKASLDALRSNTMQLDGVRDAAIEENVTMQPDESGIPPKAFQLTVLGGQNDDIAQRITETRAAGIQSFGDTTANGQTRDGVERPEGFDRAEAITVYASVHLYVGENFPEDGNKRVENAIIEYIGGTTVDGQTFPGIGMGDDVFYDQVFKRAVNVQGVNRLDLTVGLTEPPTNTDDIVIGDKQAAETGGGAIVVTNDL